ncbi:MULTISPECIES: B12-binding domain-containing radical SAM protein [unclassified Wolbachia]|uniref:B12-binding domain-containing radical SAM protein n=2 Tax=Wolbachia TaxID=953 RepID=UPI0021D53736|nr:MULTISPECIES: radical SAM protein [unclassified Wolbachia]UXX40474.1 radical SAM protein [Wolbachia endosymbiont of Oryzaephilus surinamensis]
MFTLSTYLKSLGYNTTLLDSNYKISKQVDLLAYLSNNSLKFYFILVFLNKTDAYGIVLKKVADELRLIKLSYKVVIIGFGYLAASASEELMEYEAVDLVVTKISILSFIQYDSYVQTLAENVQANIDKFYQIRGLQNSIKFYENSIISIEGSSGCNARCTFCAYNEDVGHGWYGRNVTEAAKDIHYLYEVHNITRFAFSDNEFGGNLYECSYRAKILADHLNDIRDKISIALNIRSEVLDADSILNFSNAGVKTFLIGIESFNERTLKKIFGKLVDQAHLHKVIKECDKNNIKTVTSYILWHPWQTIESIKFELDKIEKFGRYRIPQFLTNSILKVMPGTPIELKIKRDNLLKKSLFHRSFEFQDNNTKVLYNLLKTWYEENVYPTLRQLNDENKGDIRQIAELKIKEFEWLKQQLI